VIMKIVVKKVGQKPEIREVKCEVGVLHDIIGGYMTTFRVFDNVLCVCDEEGDLKKRLPNFVFNGVMIVGDVFFCAAGDTDFESLNDEQAGLLIDALTTFEESIKRKIKS